MTVLSPTDIAYLRTRPHRTKLHMAIFRPSTAMAATVNSPSIVRGEVDVPFTLVSGSSTNVVRGMTMLVGTSPGGDDLGRVRVRSSTTGVISVAENSIIWQDGANITVLKLFEPWAVYPRIVLGGDNVPTFYKDWDITYTDQNEVFDPIPVMGSDMFSIIDPGTGQAIIYFDGSNSYDLNSGGTISSFAWTFEGALTPTSPNGTPGIIAWDTPGDYIVSMTIVNSNGKSFTSYRHICIRTEPGGIDPPIVNWGIDEPLTSDYSRGDWEGRYWMLQDAGDTIVYPHALIMFVAINYYGATNVNLGGSQIGRKSLLFSGYIRAASLELFPEYSKVSFSISGISGRMSAEETFSVSIEDNAAPSTWYQLQSMTIGRATNHYIRWHTTLYAVADVIQNDTYLGIQVQFADFQRSPLYQAIDQFLSSTMIGHAIVDRQGRMWLERKIDIVPVSDRTPGTVMAIERGDWMDNVSISQVREDPVSYVETAGIHYSGSGVFNSVISIAPGNAPDYEGTVQATTGLVLVDQTVTNVLAGNVIADANKEFKEVSFKLAGNYPVFDIAPQERVLMNLDGIDNKLQLVWSDKPFIPRKISINYDRENEMMTAEVTIEEETDGPAGIPGPYPGVPPVQPPSDVPPPPDPQPQPDPGVHPLRVLVGIDPAHGKVFVTGNFYNSSPTYVDITSGITGTPIQVVTDKQNGFRAFLITASGLYRKADVFGVGAWSLIFDATDVAAALGTGSTCKFECLACDPSRSGVIAFTAGYTGVLHTSNSVHKIFYSTDGGDNISVGAQLPYHPVSYDWSTEIVSISFGQLPGTGLVGGLAYDMFNSPSINQPMLWSFSGNGSTITLTRTPGNQDADGVGTWIQHSSAYGTDIYMYWRSRPFDKGLARFPTGHGGSTLIFDPYYPTYAPSQACGVEPGANIWMGISQTNHFFLSQHGATDPTWTDFGVISGYTGLSILHLGDTPYNWARAGLSGIQYSADGGLTWSNRLGNLVSAVGSGFSVNWMDVLLEL